MMTYKQYVYKRWNESLELSAMWSADTKNWHNRSVFSLVLDAEFSKLIFEDISKCFSRLFFLQMKNI